LVDEVEGGLLRCWNGGWDVGGGEGEGEGKVGEGGEEREGKGGKEGKIE